MRLPGIISKGTNLTEWSKCNETYLRSITPRSSGGIAVSIGPSGATFAPQQNPPKSSGHAQVPSADFPWEIIPSTISSGETPHAVVEIYYGEIDSETIATAGLSGNMVLSDRLAFVIDPCDAAGMGTDGQTSIIYLVITFDASTREITSKTLGYTTSSGASVPDDTDTEKYVMIGQVKLAKSTSSSSYSVLNQQLNADLYVDRAYFISNSTSGHDRTFYADSDIVQIYSEGIVSLLSASKDDELAFLRLFDDGVSNFLEGKMDSTNGIAGLSGYCNGGSHHFDLEADDDSGNARLTLHDDSSTTLAELLEDGVISSLLGSAGSGAWNFLSKADSGAGKALVSLYDDGSNDYAELHIETNIAQLHGLAGAGSEKFYLAADHDLEKAFLTGQAGNEDVNFSLNADNSANIAALDLYAGGAHSENLTAEIIAGTATTITGSSGSGGTQNFDLTAADADGTSSLYLYDTAAAERLECKIDSGAGISSVKGSSGSLAQNFDLIADDAAGETTLHLYDNGNVEYVKLTADESGGIASVQGSVNSGARTFRLESNDTDDYVSLNLIDGYGHYGELKVDSSSNEVHLTMSDSNGVADYATDSAAIADNEGNTATYGADQIYLSLASGNSITIDDPDHNASWQEISVCMSDGTTKTMKVLGTDPY